MLFVNLEPLLLHILKSLIETFFDQLFKWNFKFLILFESVFNQRVDRFVDEIGLNNKKNTHCLLPWPSSMVKVYPLIAPIKS